MKKIIFALCYSISVAFPAFSEETKIVSWNASPSLYEALSNRTEDFARIVNDLDPDVLVLIEMAGDLEVREIARSLGWAKYYGVTSNWGVLSTQVYFALEAAVISKIPIVAAIEYDASPDGHHELFSHSGTVSGLVAEKQLSASGIPGFGDTLRATDRGTIRVDLENGLTIFPVHLKSNRNSACSSMNDAVKTLEKNSIVVPQDAVRFLENGFPAATAATASNAKKRERVMAAVTIAANEAISSGRTAVIAGDFNTGYEPGKFGKQIADCQLSNFSCAKGPFPVSACQGGDGYDDTLGMLEEGLVGTAKWKILSRGLGRTYDDEAFSDHAIDHIAVPTAAASRFSEAARALETYGSDHFPIFSVFQN